MKRKINAYKNFHKMKNKYLYSDRPIKKSMHLESAFRHHI